MATSVFCKHIDNAVRSGEDAFWEAIHKQYPEIRSGDFTPEQHQAFWNACNTAVLGWLKNNSITPHFTIYDKEGEVTKLDVSAAEILADKELPESVAVWSVFATVGEIEEFGDVIVERFL